MDLVVRQAERRPARGRSPKASGVCSWSLPNHQREARPAVKRLARQKVAKSRLVSARTGEKDLSQKVEALRQQSAGPAFERAVDPPETGGSNEDSDRRHSVDCGPKRNCDSRLGRSRRKEGRRRAGGHLAGNRGG